MVMRKRWWICAAVLGLSAVAAVPPAHAQNHGEVGIFGEYFRNSSSSTNFGGLGARLSVNPATHLQLEAEVGYDFEQLFTEGFTNPSNGSVSFQQSSLRVLHGLFGPKIQSGGGALRGFATVKGGVINFRFDPRPPGFSTFTSSFDNLRSNNVSGVLYPGGGFEAYLGPIGLRFDVGDEIYFQNGTHNNLRMTFGPHIRF
jgi:hypothetical protein